MSFILCILLLLSADIRVILRNCGFGRLGGLGHHVFEPWPSQTNDLKIYTFSFLARHSALLGLGRDQLVQYRDNVTEWDISS